MPSKIIPPEPTEAELRSMMGKSYAALEALLETNADLRPEWKYYGAKLGWSPQAVSRQAQHLFSRSARELPGRWIRAGRESRRNCSEVQAPGCGQKAGTRIASVPGRPWRSIRDQVKEGSCAGTDAARDQEIGVTAN